MEVVPTAVPKPHTDRQPESRLTVDTWLNEQGPWIALDIEAAKRTEQEPRLSEKLASAGRSFAADVRSTFVASRLPCSQPFLLRDVRRKAQCGMIRGMETTTANFTATLPRAPVHGCTP